MNKKKLGGFLSGLAGLAAAIVALRQPHPRVVTPEQLAEWQRICGAVWQEELQRPIDAETLPGCVQAQQNGASIETLRAGLRETDEWKHLREPKPEPPPDPKAEPEPLPPLRPVRVEGRFWVTDAGAFRPLFQSGLTLLVRTPTERAAFLDETRALGFNGVRVFAGALRWAGQSAEHARATLHTLLDEAAARGLYVYVSAITDSRDGGYDVEAHLRQVAAIVAVHPNALLEVANETFHPTQADVVNDPVRLLALARRAVPSGLPFALGAADADEPDPSGHYPTDGGAFNTAHLDRGRDTWNQVRRLREIAAISEATRKPAMSGEPMGADERMGGATGTKQRRNDPPFFFAMGALCRGFELGCVFHSEAGLQAQRLGPVQRECAEAFLAGWWAVDTDERLSFQNAKWAGSPIADADFNRVVRAYSFVTGNRGFTVLVGLSGDPALRYGGGWRSRRVVAERPGVQILEIER